MVKRFNNQTMVYVIAIAVIVVAFFLLGGGHWISGRMSQSHMSYWNWTHIIVSLAIGIVIGLLVAKRKW